VGLFTRLKSNYYLDNFKLVWGVNILIKEWLVLSPTDRHNPYGVHDFNILMSSLNEIKSAIFGHKMADIMSLFC